MKNREIKFRAWDKDHMENNVCACYRNLDKSQIILMQFTGLYDKNGKEIYEGDLLEDERRKILEVKWGEGEWLAGKLALNANNFFENQSKYLETIGNIYENLKLLEYKKIKAWALVPKKGKLVWLIDEPVVGKTGKIFQKRM